MKRICIVSPYGGDKDNQDLAARFCRAVLDAHLAAKEEVALFASHLMYPHFLDDSSEVQRKLAMAMARSFMEVCDEVWVLAPWMPEPTPWVAEKPITLPKTSRRPLFLGDRYGLPPCPSIMTPGMINEIEYAEKLGKRVVAFHSIDDVEVTGDEK